MRGKPVSNRNRNIFHAADLIKESNRDDKPGKSVLREHFSKQDVKEARNLFRNMMCRSLNIIENSSQSEVSSAHVNERSNDGAMNEQCPESDIVPNNRYSIGQHVLCNYCNHGQWCPGTIADVSSTGMYMIHYEDGDVEEDREESSIMTIPDIDRIIEPSSFQLGDKILGNYEEKGIWFEGIITSIVVEGQGMLCDIEYLDGDVETSVPGKLIVHAVQSN